MIDIHCHFLYGIDDGASKIDESLNMLRTAERLGIKAIIATPHYDGRLYMLDRYNEAWNEIVYKVRDFDVRILKGCEVLAYSLKSTIGTKISDLALAKSKYILVEIPSGEAQDKILSSIEECCARGWIPILAHPERCFLFQRNFSLLDRLTGAGCMLQVDAGSIAGVYGRRVKKLAKKLITTNRAHFVASNAHFASDYSEWYEIAFTKVIQWAGFEYTNKLFSGNAEHIIHGNSKYDEKLLKIVDI